MTIRLHYRTISSYRELAPGCRIIYPEQDQRSPSERYLVSVGSLLGAARACLTYTNPYGLVTFVFANQAATHEISSRHLAHLIEERRAFTARHLAEVQRRRPFHEPTLLTPDFPDDTCSGVQ